MSLAADGPKGPELVRISNIAGRYLVFDPDAVARLRRYNNTNGTLVGTTPQQPTQNVFLGLPIELRPEEVCTLLRRNSAYVVDSVDAHNTTLRSDSSAASRRHFIKSLRRSKQAAHYTLAQRSAQKGRGAARYERSSEDVVRSCSSRIGDKHIASADVDHVQHDNQNINVGHLAVTPVSSATFLAFAGILQIDRTPVRDALCGFLQSRGQYMTPGLRFGAQYSVYPGDPLRFHAHFMANEYYWDEQIPILDIVGGGRLATAVKKAFLIGGRDTTSETHGPDSIRTYSIEWAAM
ncbi:hypothetical protein EsDP_00006545 [Epichloe bromicola]|uniref:tRNA-splicing endonuclease subunit Sen34 n=1 Tax=Epichloe bromicola TaxID=79588 RepID=A0ABQ0CXX2_9HYPO